MLELVLVVSLWNMVMSAWLIWHAIATKPDPRQAARARIAEHLSTSAGRERIRAHLMRRAERMKGPG